MRREGDRIFFEADDPRIVHLTWLGESMPASRAAEIFKAGQDEEESIERGLKHAEGGGYGEGELQLMEKRADMQAFKLEIFLSDLSQLAPDEIASGLADDVFEDMPGWSDK